MINKIDKPQNPSICLQAKNMIPKTEILKKLALLRQNDPDFQVFGAAKQGSYGHEYGLAPVADLRLVESFEQALGRRLPEDYREFILTIGNGGAGPGYGFDGLSYNDIGQIEDYKQPFDLNDFKQDGEFMKYEDGTEFQGVDYSGDLRKGCKFLYTEGCAIDSYLILNAVEEQHVGKIITFAYTPIAIGRSFIDDYMPWLNWSVKQFEKG